jgi:3-(3-hydroxy-phenyl)propionate hydroxylase
MSQRDRVIVVGGGPVGLTAALNLVRQDIPVLLLEASSEVYDEPRAATVHPPTMELFATLGVMDQFHARGNIVRHYQYRDRREGVVAEFDLEILRSETDFPYRLMLEQHKICQILMAELVQAPACEILTGHSVETVAQDDEGVVVRAGTSEGAKSFQARYAIGADGGRSAVRKSMKVEFEGFSYEERFIVIATTFDFGAEGYAETCYIADPDDWCAMFKVPGPDDRGLWRVTSAVKAGQSNEEVCEDAAIEARLQRFHPKPEPYEIVHRNIYQLHQRVASNYRDGRILVAGDAAHVNNPLGGMGMNFGFHDAFNLAEKIGRIWRGEAAPDLLDQYDRQRRTVATEYLQRQTIENKKNIEQSGEAERQSFHSELRAIVADEERQRSYLKRVTMIDGLRRANSID